jgi:hypothetical protein
LDFDDVPKRMNRLRFRTIFILLGSLLVLAALLLTDVDNGIQTVLMVGGLTSGLLAVLFSHLARKALMDYPEADMQRLFHTAGKSPTGAGLALVAIAIIVYALIGLFGPRAHAQDLRTYVPPQALPYMPMIKGALARDWPEHPKPGMVPATFEHESGCFALKRMCWNMKAQLKTQREEGASVIQITRAYRADGSLRFDALQEMVDRYPQLKGWNWGNVYDRPDYAITAGVLKLRDGFRMHARTVRDPIQALLFADLGYNAGNGRVSSDRRACGLVKGCDPQRWFGHVERTCTASKQPIYGTRSACDISRHHVTDVWARSDKYGRLLS